MSGESKPDAAPDPFSIWRQIFTVNEEAFSNAVNQYVNSENYAASMGKYMENAMGVQKNVQESMEKYLHSNGLPTRSDFARLAGQIVEIDTRLDDMQDKLTEELSTIELKKIGYKVDKVGESLTRLESKLELLLPVTSQVALSENRLFKIEAILEQILRVVQNYENNKMGAPELSVPASSRFEDGVVTAKLNDTTIETSFVISNPEMEGYLALGEDKPIIKKASRRKNQAVSEK